MPSVMQEWVNNLSYMQQSVLITAVRGCDGLPKKHVSKFVLRWLRRCIMLSAMDGRVLTDSHDPGGGNFTGPLPPSQSFLNIVADYLASVDEVPHHFHLHLMHAAEIIGYKHPNQDISREWRHFYRFMVRDMHLLPECLDDMDYRLGDNQEQWTKAGGEVLDMGRSSEITNVDNGDKKKSQR